MVNNKKFGTIWINGQATDVAESGTFRLFSNITQRNALAIQDRAEGMLGYTAEDKKYWQLLPLPWDHTDNDWAEFNSGGGTSLGWINVVDDYGATGDGTTDDTDAIQDAIDAAVVLGNATIYFPAGVYLCNGTLTGTGRQSVLRIPTLSGGTWATIEFRGCAPPALPFFGSVDIGSTNHPVQGTVIKSTGNGGAVFGSEVGAVGGAGFNSSRVIFRNLTILTKDNPTRHGIDAYYNLQLEIDNVCVTTGKFGNHVTEPTTAGVTGIICPRTFNAAQVSLRVVLVTGYYDGYSFAELAAGDELFAQSCKRAWVLSSGNLSHALHFGRICDTSCEIGIAVDAQTRVVIDEYDAERAVSGWATRLYDIDNSLLGALILGKMNYHLSTAGSGAANSALLLNASGAADYLEVHQIGVRPSMVLTCSGTTQTVTNNSYTPIVWTALADGGDNFGWSSSVNPERITIHNAGHYAITASVGFAANNVGIRTLFIYRNAVFTQVLQGGVVPGSNQIARELVIAVGDETTAITTGTAKVTFRMPYALTLTGVRASLTTASNSGTPTIDIKESATSIFSTKLTIDANEKTSTTAAVPAVISDTALADDAEITINIDVAGTGATGLKVTLIGVTGAAEESVAQVSGTLFLNHGEYITIDAHQTSGNTLAIANLGGQSYVSKLIIAKVS